mgnify:CR=1 FL=1
MISKDEYIEFGENGFNIIPLVRSINLDLDSSIKVFSKIKDKRNTFFADYDDEFNKLIRFLDS